MTTKFYSDFTEEQWRALRAQDITSTESAALFGLSPYTTELELFYRKQSGEIYSIEDNARMKAGRYLEPSIAQLAGSELKCDVEPMKGYATDEVARMGASFDFEIVSGDYAGWILEIKNVDYIVYRNDWEDDEAPDHIEVQVQHQLELTERPGAIIACLVGGNDLRLIHRERNEKMGAGLRKRIAKFWEDVAANTPPEPDYVRDADFLISLHQVAGDNVLVAEEHDPISSLLVDYQMLKKAESDAIKFAKAKKAEILDAIGDDVSKVIAGNLSLSCTMTKETPPTTITPEMVGQTYGGRRGFRNFRLTERKSKK